MTNRIELKWDIPYEVDEQRYYCSETPIDLENLPEPKAVFASDVRAYADTDITAGQTYYVRIGSVRNGIEKISNEIGASTLHKYRWLLILITANNGDSYTSMQEVEIASVAGGADITTTSTPTSQSSYFTDDNAKASNLVDNNLTNYQFNSWISGTSAAYPHWVAIDLSAPKDFVEVKIYPQNYSGGVARAPKDFKIQGSNDSTTWTDIKSFSNVTGWVAGTAKKFNLITGVVT